MIIRKKSLVTVDILYWMPDYTNVLQKFVWQTSDIVPEYPRVHSFLNYWQENIEAGSVKTWGMISGIYLYSNK